MCSGGIRRFGFHLRVPGCGNVFRNPQVGVYGPAGRADPARRIDARGTQSGGEERRGGCEDGEEGARRGRPRAGQVLLPSGAAPRGSADDDWVIICVEAIINEKGEPVRPPRSGLGDTSTAGNPPPRAQTARPCGQTVAACLAIAGLAVRQNKGGPGGGIRWASKLKAAGQVVCPRSTGWALEPSGRGHLSIRKFQASEAFP